ncbi:hypothetical protein ScPMuIL_018987 [Solemya velum]
MWYEILPSAAIVYACLTIPSYANWVMNKLFRNGHGCGRNWDASVHDWSMYLRDRRITGSEYRAKGLESIPEVD